jgi:hypothetical protein
MAIFTAECTIKLFAMRCLYFKDTWNQFDFTVVVSTILVLTLSFIPNLGLDLST